MHLNEKEAEKFINAKGSISSAKEHEEKPLIPSEATQDTTLPDKKATTTYEQQDIYDRQDFYPHHYHDANPLIKVEEKASPD